MQNSIGLDDDAMDEESEQAISLFSGLTAQGQGGWAGKQPRHENYLDMWKSTFCPQFTPISFTFIIWVINTSIYVMSVLMMASPGKRFNPLIFLGPDLQTLVNWGALYPWEIRYNY